MPRTPIADEVAAEPVYKSSVNFTTSGSFMLDRILNGGWPHGRVNNIVGDRSSGKTLIAIEAAINYARAFGVQAVRYCEAEAAFDQAYAQEKLGMPKGIGFSGEIKTAEEFVADVLLWLSKRKDGQPCLYILDSLDALSDDAEMKREAGEASFGMAKAKAVSEFFRKHVYLLERKACTLIVISQIRDVINPAMFGETKKRSGGHALDFYSTNIIWLYEVGKLERTVLKVKRIYGLKVDAMSKKCKVGPAFRRVPLEIIFNYGVDDEMSMLAWLDKNECLDLLPHDGPKSEIKKEVKADIDEARNAGDRETINAINAQLRAAVAQRWDEVEALIQPKMRKYT